ncbi:hypothetical protein ABS767_13040 [Sphingomonas sp. ST-64]|uniref:YbaB/EbfC DNA-binding family protein n=1 Tax=Sphingomonas plantiphila TaxID=3163295 RepID=A0ABW8YPD6_9SPHN
MTEEPATEPFKSPGVASAEEGHVVLDGPDGIAITLTIGAARQTGESLIAAADAAARQLSES